MHVKTDTFCSIREKKGFSVSAAHRFDLHQTDPENQMKTIQEIFQIYDHRNDLSILRCASSLKRGFLKMNMQRISRLCKDRTDRENPLF